MVIVGPAVGFGAIAALIVIFVAGYILVYSVLEAIAKRAARRPSTKLTVLSEDNIFAVAIVAGLIPVVVAILLYFNSPRESRSEVTGVLTVLGFIVGALSFVISLAGKAFADRPRIEPQARYRPPSSGTTYRSPNNPPPQYQPPNTRPPSAPSTSNDPYRDLLAKALYNKDLAERLIDDERKCAPYANLDELCRRAINRLERAKR